jgi:hypothetical protein
MDSRCCFEYQQCHPFNPLSLACCAGPYGADRTRVILPGDVRLQAQQAQHTGALALALHFVALQVQASGPAVAALQLLIGMASMRWEGDDGEEAVGGGGRNDAPASQREGKAAGEGAAWGGDDDLRTAPFSLSDSPDANLGQFEVKVGQGGGVGG